MVDLPKLHISISGRQLVSPVIDRLPLGETKDSDSLQTRMDRCAVTAGTTAISISAEETCLL